MTGGTCLNCAHWLRYEDPIIGSCLIATPYISLERLRFQYDRTNCPDWAFGEDRPAARYERHTDPKHDRCAYYERYLVVDR